MSEAKCKKTAIEKATTNSCQQIEQLLSQLQSLEAENKELKATIKDKITDAANALCKSQAERMIALQAELDKANELLRYVYKLPMNEAGSYEENIAWKEAVEQVLSFFSPHIDFIHNFVVLSLKL